jgi:hypothetical protein
MFEEQFCFSGSWNSNLINPHSTCDDCPSGEICTGTSKETCPIGQYCPGGNSDKTAILCPAGTYAETDGLSSLTKCSACPIGKYCPIGTKNTDLGDLDCYDGYDCFLRSTIPSPTTICPAGYYCPLG